MNPIFITENCVIYNDMEWGWVQGKGQPKWHYILYCRWKAMWRRCRNPKDKEYNSYKDCDIDEDYRFLSNYINDIMQLENFDLLCLNPSEWEIDKDIKGDRNYYKDNLSIVSTKANRQDRYDRYKRPIRGISLKDGSIITFDFVNESKAMGFKVSSIIRCCKGRMNSHKGYKWEYIEGSDEGCLSD